MNSKKIEIRSTDNQYMQLPYWLVELIEKGRFIVNYKLFTDEYRYFVSW